MRCALGLELGREIMGKQSLPHPGGHASLALFPHCCDCPSTCAQHHLLEGALLQHSCGKKPYGFLRRATESPDLLPLHLDLASVLGCLGSPHFVHGGGARSWEAWGMMGRAVSHHSVRKASLETLSCVTLEVGGSVSSVHLGVYTLIPGLISDETGQPAPPASRSSCGI